ncbi:BglII/BstYI family type II restriction endonuclease [Bacillus sp. FSL K6-0067]|uniref:BglII/BstYI family type II restriction endonuclease n=1 Tax=Bacillus sp. FSL K6-0067 TaxID=2921412 RepID=UPI00077AFBA8|nr:BglII/BstYI family type II restriction endonuclease [Bacillus cereus]KXY11472.1 hypothetical protein AT267_17745 [Bacillus cereus]
MKKKHSDAWVQKNYFINEKNNGLIILQNKHLDLWTDTKFALRGFRLHYKEIVSPGGGKSLVTQRLEKFFKKKNWKSVEFKELHTVSIGKNFGKKAEEIFDTKEVSSQTHEIDLFKNRVAVEIEWNNKHQFFSRDLETFDYLYKIDMINVGVIITKHTSLHELFESLGYLVTTKKKVADKYGSTHTHTEKLKKLLGANRCSCPIVVIGITQDVYRV